MARNRHAEFAAWSEGAEAHLGERLPRSFDLRSFGPEVHAEAASRMERFGRELPQLAHAQVETYQRGIAKAEASGTANPAYVEGMRTGLEGATRSAAALRDLGGIDTSIRSMTTNVQRLLDQGIRKAKSATRFNEQAGTPRLEIPGGGAFYPEHAGAYGTIAASDRPGDEEHARRLVLAAPRFSAGAMPQVELQGAAGLSRIHTNAPDVGISLTHSSAEALNAAAATVRSGVEKSSIPQVGRGTHSIADLPPEHVGILLQHRAAMAQGKETKHSAQLEKVGYSRDWQDLDTAASAVVGAAGKSGMGVVASGLHVMRSPQFWSRGPTSVGAWKVPSYSTTIALHHGEAQALQQAVHHMVGASIHGQQYWEANPGAEEHVAKYMNHPALQNPKIVSDIHNARALMGLPYETAVDLGDIPRPETMFSRPKGMEAGEIPSSRRGTGLQVADLGYLAQEHATQNVRMSYPLQGARHEVPAHVKQALVWNMQQAQNPKVAAKLKSGERSILQSAIDVDPRKALNPSGVIPRL